MSITQIVPVNLLTFATSGREIKNFQERERTVSPLKRRVSLSFPVPSAVESVSATANGTMSISASWSTAQVEECVDHYYACIRDADTLTSDCLHTADSQAIFNVRIIAETYVKELT